MADRPTNRQVALTDRQVAFLRVLAAYQRKPGGGGMGAGQTFYEAFPDAAYSGRRDAGATRTLDGLQKLGLVSGSYAYLEATGRDWTITSAGQMALDEIDGVKEWRVQFMGGSHTVVKAKTEKEARRGPWNPSNGFIVSCEEVVNA